MGCDGRFVFMEHAFYRGPQARTNPSLLLSANAVFLFVQTSSERKPKPIVCFHYKLLTFEPLL